MSTTAKIAGLNCKDTGVTPKHAKDMWSKLGSSHMGIVEFIVDEHTESTDDTKGVKLVINQVELADDGNRAEHLRELQRAIYMARQPDKALTAGVETTPVDVVTQGKDLVLVCDSCSHSLGSQGINHGRRTGVQCIWVPCRHTVTDADDDACLCGMTR